MNSLKQEIAECLSYNKKDTPRKAKLFLKKWIADLEYIINHIEPQLKEERYKDMLGVYAMHLGEKKREHHLRKLKKEAEYIRENINTLITLV